MQHRIVHLGNRTPVPVVIDSQQAGWRRAFEQLGVEGPRRRDQPSRRIQIRVVTLTLAVKEPDRQHWQVGEFVGALALAPVKDLDPGGA